MEVRGFRTIVVIAVLAVAAAIGWMFALLDIPLPQVPENRRVTYAFDNTSGNVQCIITTGTEDTPKFRILPENVSSERALVQFTVMAENAVVSFDDAGDFEESSSGWTTVPANTPGSPSELTFYVKPNQNATDISLTLSAQAIEPSDMPLRNVIESSTVVFYHDEQTGDYCPRN